MFDLVIIGGAAVGCSAAIYAARRGLNFKVITTDIGGEVALSGQVGNWPGIIDIQGFELAQKLRVEKYQNPDWNFKGNCNLREVETETAFVISQPVSP